MLSKLVQEFIDRLIKMSEKVFGTANVGMLLVKQLAYEKASMAC